MFSIYAVVFNLYKTAKKVNDVTLRFTIAGKLPCTKGGTHLLAWYIFCNNLILDIPQVLVNRSKILYLVHFCNLLSMLLYRNWVGVKIFLFWFRLNTFSWNFVIFELLLELFKKSCLQNLLSYNRWLLFYINISFNMCQWDIKIVKNQMVFL